MTKINSRTNPSHKVGDLMQLFLRYIIFVNMIIELKKNRTVCDVRMDFTGEFPFLTIEFYKYVQGRLGSSIRQKMVKSTGLHNSGLRREGQLEVLETMTVRQLEKTFIEQYGLFVQVSRRSGAVWLETTISDNWTLKQQNEHGRELSELTRKNKDHRPH
jgi:hypothetical protein